MNLNENFGITEDGVIKMIIKWKKPIIYGFVFIITLLLFVHCNGKPATGQKIGQIVKVADEGLITDTCEAQLIRGGLKDGSGAVSSAPFDFTIDNDDLEAKARKYMEEQQEVVIDYKKSLWYMTWSSENNGIFLKDIKPVKK